MNQFKKEYERLISEYEEDVDAAAEIMKDALRTLQQYCIHDWHFVADPSGNNDSCYLCSNCMLEKKRL